MLALLLGGFMVFRWAATPSYSPLYSQMSSEDSAAVINDDPYGEGWIYEVRVTEAGPLMDAEAYAAENDD